MTIQASKPPVASGKSVEKDAETLESKFGDAADIYAENRSEAARLRGAEDAARHWRQVESEIEDATDRE